MNLIRLIYSLSSQVYQGLQELGVHIILSDRLDLSSLNGKGFGNQETMVVKTLKGCEIEADLMVRVPGQVFVRRFIESLILLLLLLARQPNWIYDGQLLCTGQTPNTSLLHTMDSSTIDPKSRMVHVSRTMQILALREKDTTFDEGNFDGFRSTSPTLCGTAPPSPVDTLAESDSTSPVPMLSTSGMFVKSVVDASRAPLTFVYPHLFAIGDAADAFGAIKAGHTAYYQGELAARNVIKLIQGDAGTLKAPLQPSAFTPEMEADSRGAEEDSEGKPELEEYVPTPPMIRVSLGLVSLPLRPLHLFARFTGSSHRPSQHMRWLVLWAQRMTESKILEPLTCGEDMGTRMLTKMG